MKFLVLLALVAVSLAADVDYHETLDDKFDFNKLSTKEIGDIAFCLNESGPCNELIASYKQHYPAAVLENCGRCNRDQMNIALTYFTRMEREWPQEFAIFKQRMDPTGQYWDTFIQTLKKNKY